MKLIKEEGRGGTIPKFSGSVRFQSFRFRFGLIPKFLVPVRFGSRITRNYLLLNC